MLDDGINKKNIYWEHSIYTSKINIGFPKNNLPEKSDFVIEVLTKSFVLLELS